MFLVQYASKELECLKGALEDLAKMQTDLAEFFCEDTNTFRFVNIVLYHDVLYKKILIKFC